MISSILWLAILAPPRFPDAGSPTNARMLAVAQKFTEQTGIALVVLGSWVSGKDYRDPLKGGGSDHDMRIILPPGIKPAEAESQWRQAQSQLGALIREEFGQDAPGVLSKTNLYAPKQILEGVKDSSSALEVYKKIGAVPNLGYQGPVDAKTPAQFFEGLYGKGSTTYIQAYEEEAGRVIFKSDNKVAIGFTDLVHAGEEYARYTIEGCGSNAKQWAEHGLGALADKDPKSVAKYLRRMASDLRKGSSMARISGVESFHEEILSLWKALQSKLDSAAKIAATSPAQAAKLREEAAEELARLAPRIRSAFQSGSWMGSALQFIDRAGGLKRALFDRIYRALGGKESVWLRCAQELGPIVFMEAIDKVCLASELGEAAGKDGVLGVLKAVGLRGIALPESLMIELAEAIIEAAKEGGYSFVASFQDPWDLLDGIYSSLGREDVTDTSYKLDVLVRKYKDTDEEQLKGLIRSIAMKSAARGGNAEAMNEADRGVGEAVYSKCWPVIVGAWRSRRESLNAEVMSSWNELYHEAVLIKADKSNVELKSEPVEVKVELSLSPNAERLSQRIAENMRTLGYKNPGVGMMIRWQGGRSTNDDAQRRYTITEPGIIEIEASVDFFVAAQGLDDWSPLRKPQTVRAATLITAVPALRNTGALVPRGIDANFPPATPVDGLVWKLESVTVDWNDGSLYSGKNPSSPNQKTYPNPKFALLEHRAGPGQVWFRIKRTYYSSPKLRPGVDAKVEWRPFEDEVECLLEYSLPAEFTGATAEQSMHKHSPTIQLPYRVSVLLRGQGERPENCFIASKFFMLKECYEIEKGAERFADGAPSLRFYEDLSNIKDTLYPLGPYSASKIFQLPAGRLGKDPSMPSQTHEGDRQFLVFASSVVRVNVTYVAARKQPN